MMSSQSRIMANLTSNSKENMSPRRKRSSEDAFESMSPPVKITKRRTVDAFLLPKGKSKPLFSSKPSNKLNIKKQPSIKSYYSGENVKPASSSKVKVFDENNKENTKQKPKKDDTFSLMCAEEAPEKYWELLAEERRKALEVALKENQELAEEIREKDATIGELKTEVSELQETAKHAEYLASVLEELGKDCGVTADDDEESDSEVFDRKDISVSYDETTNEDASTPTASPEDTTCNLDKVTDEDSRPSASHATGAGAIGGEESSLKSKLEPKEVTERSKAGPSTEELESSFEDPDL